MRPCFANGFVNAVVMGIVVFIKVSLSVDERKGKTFFERWYGTSVYLQVSYEFDKGSKRRQSQSSAPQRSSFKIFSFLQSFLRIFYKNNQVATAC